MASNFLNIPHRVILVRLTLVVHAMAIPNLKSLLIKQERSALIRSAVVQIEVCSQRDNASWWVGQLLCNAKGSAFDLLPKTNLEW
jgi:hypothetical protein